MKNVSHRLCGRHRCLFIMAGIVLLQCGICEARNRLSDIRFWSSPTGTRIVLDLQASAHYDSFTLAKPDRLVVDLKGCALASSRKLLTINDGMVTSVKLAARQGGTRIVVGLRKKTDHSIFPLKAIEGKPPRLVIDITCPVLATAGRAERERTRQCEALGTFIIVIDPGHGGEDPGAVSRNGTREKDIVLATAKLLQSRLNRHKGTRAYLTRRGDYFIPLQERVQIAQQYGADLFISLHVDSSFSRQTAGSSVYCLSFKGASDNAARTVAARENASDMIGGIPLQKQDSDLNSIIVDLVQTHSLNASLSLANTILRAISQVNKVHTPKPHQANFVVLKAPDIPSILIEIDFISNPRSEKKLRSDAFQSTFAARLADTLAHYATALPMRAKTRIAGPTGMRQHVVRQGDTLGKIARTNGVTLAALCAANRLQASTLLRTGIRLTVPPAGQQPPKAPRPSFHVVQKGDTLTSIAGQYNTSRQRLQALNDLNHADILLTGTRLRIPET